MLPADNERQFIEDFLLIPDPHERLAAIVASCTGEGIPEAERREGDLVPGCVSRVWISVRQENGAVHYRWDAESPLVRGLAGLVCRVYHGCEAASAAVYETGILAGLRLDRQLSPTRLNGLTNAARRCQELAASLRIEEP